MAKWQRIQELIGFAGLVGTMFFLGAMFATLQADATCKAHMEASQ